MCKFTFAALSAIIKILLGSLFFQVYSVAPIRMRMKKKERNPNETRWGDAGYDRIISREERIAEIRQFTLLSDVFLSVALVDPAACQHVLRILTGIESLTVKEVRTQYTLSKIQSHSARLDVLAEDGDGTLYLIEIQRKDTVDHPRRIRFYGAMADCEFLEKGREYKDLPERYVIYISETDIWKKGKTVYPVRKYLGEKEIPYDDGEHIIYVNAQVDDGSRIAELMKYFRTADPEDNSEGELSKRVRFLKEEEGGRKTMCEVAEKIERRGEQIGEQRGREAKARDTARNLSEMGMSLEKIAQAVDENINVVRQWLSGAESKS